MAETMLVVLSLSLSLELARLVLDGWKIHRPFNPTATAAGIFSSLLFFSLNKQMAIEQKENK